MKILKAGICEIVSSGYEDRFLTCTEEVILIIDDIEYKVSTGQAVKAIASMRGLNKNDFNVTESIAKELRAVPSSFHATYIVKNEHGSATIRAEVRPEVVRGGIASATGFTGLTEFGKNNAINAAKGITESEKEFIRFGLEQINKKHRDTERPIIEFSI